MAAMLRCMLLPLHAFLIFYLSLSASVAASDEKVLLNGAPRTRGYSKGELMPVSCLNRTM